MVVTVNDDESSSAFLLRFECQQPAAGEILAVVLDQGGKLLEQDYVMLKVDDVNDLGGAEIFGKISADTPGGGIPFHVIYHPDGTRMIDSNGPLGNIGFPSSHERKRHWKTMLQATATTLTEQQILQLLETL